jgi:hypothetical protein
MSRAYKQYSKRVIGKSAIVNGPAHSFACCNNQFRGPEHACSPRRAITSPGVEDIVTCPMGVSSALHRRKLRVDILARVKSPQTNGLL